MIDAKDLMVGNCVYDKVMNRYVVIHGIHETHNFVWVNYANGSGIYTRGFDEIEAVELTEDILVKCGFEKGKWGSCSITLANGFSKLTYWSDKKAIELNNTSGTKWGHVYCDYLHELQNLFKILTKKELEVKL